MYQMHMGKKDVTLQIIEEGVLKGTYNNVFFCFY